MPIQPKPAVAASSRSSSGAVSTTPRTSACGYPDAGTNTSALRTGLETMLTGLPQVQDHEFLVACLRALPSRA